MKGLAILLSFLAIISIHAQFYAPDTEYHDSVQRVFPVEAARVMSWLAGLGKGPKIDEVTYTITTRSTGESVWELEFLDSSGKRLKSVKIQYPKTALGSGIEFYRSVFSQIWRAEIETEPVRVPNREEIVQLFWSGAKLAGYSREESLVNALGLVTTNSTLPLIGVQAPRIAGLLAHAALPSVAGKLTLDSVILARAAFWLALSEHFSATKIDPLWSPLLFLSGRDRTAKAIWQREAPASKIADPPWQFWNLLFRDASARESYLFAAETRSLRYGLALITHDALVNGTGKLLADLLPEICRNPKTLARVHNYAPFLETRTTVGGGHILEGAWAYYSRLSFVEILDAIADSDSEGTLYKETLARTKEALADIKPKEFSGDASLFGFEETAPLLSLAHKEGTGKLRPCSVLTVRDALNHGWEMAGHQISCRTAFVGQSWGLRDEAQKIYRAAIDEVEGWIPFFGNPATMKITSYRESLLRLQNVERKFKRAKYLEIPFGPNLAAADTVRLWIKRCWLLPGEAEYQMRGMWDAGILGELPDFVTELQKAGGARAAAEVLEYFALLDSESAKKIPQYRELQLVLADSLPQPSARSVQALYRRDFATLTPFDRGQKMEELFWRNPEGGLENRVIRGYVEAPQFKSVKRFYSQIRTNLSDPVGFSNGSGRILWMTGYVTHDQDLMKMAVEDSASGSYYDMLINIWDHAAAGRERQLANQTDELIERYEPDGKKGLGGTLKEFLPLLPALKDPKHPKRDQALRFFGKDGGFSILRWIWIERFNMPVADAIRFLGGRENNALHNLYIAVLEKNESRALEAINAYYATVNSVDESVVLAAYVYSKVHPYRSAPEDKDLKPKDFMFIREAVSKKLKENP